MARDGNLASSVEADMLMVRMNVKDFIIDGDYADLEQYSAYLVRLETDLARADQDIQKPERVELMQRVRAELAIYSETFDAVVTYREERNDAVFRILDVQGPSMEGNLTAIMTSAEEAGDMAAAFHAGLAIKHLLLSRLYTQKFLVDNLDRQAEEVRLQFGFVQERLEILEADLQNEHRIRNLAEILRSFDIYQTTFERLVVIIQDRNDKITNTLDVIGPRIALYIGEVTDDLERTQDELGPALTSQNEFSQTLMTVVGILALTLGLGLTGLIVLTFNRMTQSIEGARAAAEQTAQTKADFLANMSHEIRTPMNGILGMAHLALRTDLNAVQGDYVQKIHGSGQHLLRIINDILDFSKIEAGKLDMEQIDFQVDDVLESVAGFVNEKVSAKGLELIYDVDPDLPSTLNGDPLRLGQVLLNYVGNAIKFTDEGEILVRVSRVRDVGRDTLVRFEVQDTGVGMTAAQVGLLFNAFQQADTSTTREFGGTGLGLVIAKQLAELMGGGEAGVSSSLGKGSTFWFTATLGPVAQTERSGARVPV